MVRQGRTQAISDLTEERVPQMTRASDELGAEQEMLMNSFNITIKPGVPTFRLPGCTQTT